MLFSSLHSVSLDHSLRYTLATMLAIFLVGAVVPDTTQAQDRHRKIIDVHMHSLHLDALPPEMDSTIGHERPTSAQALKRQSIEQMKQYNVIKAITSGDPDLLEEYKQAVPDRIIRSLWVPIGLKGDELRSYLDSLDTWYQQGRFQVIGEVLTQYSGIAPDDEILDPMWSFAAENDVPVGIHVIEDSGFSCPKSLTEGCTPSALEDVLAEYPDLRIYVMHAGFPNLDEMVELMSKYDGVYADMALPRDGGVKYLKQLVDAGYGDRIMFASDQQLWPEMIRMHVVPVEKAPFLTEEQKQAIFYKNAARFLDLESEQSGDS